MTKQKFLVEAVEEVLLLLLGAYALSLLEQIPVVQ